MIHQHVKLGLFINREQTKKAERAAPAATLYMHGGAVFGFSSQVYHTWYIRYRHVSDVPRSLQSRFSTIQTVVLTADVLQLFF